MGNLNGTIHGGALTTIIDVATTLAIMSMDHKNRANVSAELSISFISGGTVKDDLFVLSNVDRIGKKLAFTQGFIYNSKNDLLATGRHTKAFLEQTYQQGSEDTIYPRK